MIIEFYGPPASGKTSAALELAARCGFEIIKIRKRSELAWYNFLFFVSYPLKFIRIFWRLARNFGSVDTFYYKLMNTFFDYNAKYMKARKYQKAILDQGHFQNIVSLFERPLSPAVLAAYINILPKPDKLFVFNASQKLRAERVLDRGYFARKNLDEAYIAKWQNAIEHNHKLFTDNIGSIFPKTWFIDGSQTRENICHDISIIINTK